MDYLTGHYLVWAMALGGLSAVSLPLGSAVGLMTNPKPGYISVLQAFGAGALIAALSVELVAPTVLALGKEVGSGHGGDPSAAFYALVSGAVLGGILYFLLDQLVNAHGGFLRKTSTSITYFRLNKKKRQLKLLEKLSQFPLLKCLSAEHINFLVDAVHPAAYLDGETIYREGDAAKDLIFVLEGTVEVTGSGGALTQLGPGDVVGLAVVVMDVPTMARAVAKGDVTAVALPKDNFGRLRELSPEFDQACRDRTGEIVEFVREKVADKQKETERWLDGASGALKTASAIPDSSQLRRARDEHKGAPLAIWLGILIDGIPESFVIGAGLLVLLRTSAGALDSLTFGQIIPYTLIAGLFLSNFPEALASSTNMRLQGWGKRRIFFLWFSLMVITAAGAGFGFFVVEMLDHTWLVFAEGLAAGAMLTMIAAAMIPEAVHLGSANAVGLATLAGFLSAISFKLLE